MAPASADPADRRRTTVWTALVVVALMAPRLWVAAGLLGEGTRDSVDFDRFWYIGSVQATPYRDYRVEYTPAAVYLFRALAPIAGTRPHFGSVMTGLAVAADVTTAGALAVAFGPAALVAYLAITLPLIDLFYRRIDLVPTAAATLAVAALRRRRPISGAVALAGGIALKLWPLPFAMWWLRAADATLRRRAAIACTVAAAVALVFAWVGAGGPRGLIQVVTLRGATGWQVESLVGNVISIVTRHATLRSELSAFRVGELSSEMTVGLMLAGAELATLLVWFGASAGRVGATWLGSVSVLLILSPLISPQFMAWLAPGVAIAWAERDRGVALCGALTLALTAWFWPHYMAIMNGSRLEYVITARNIALCVTLAFALWTISRAKRRAARSAAVVLMVCLAVWPAQAEAQARGAMARDAVSARPSGVIRGVILGTDTGRPLRHAIVTLTSSGSNVRKTTLSDRQGRFVFSDLGAARYILSARKGGYLSVDYGARRPLDPGKPIELADAQRVDISLPLPRGSVLTGRIIDEDGDPMVGISVNAQRLGFVNGTRAFVAAGRSVSDDFGNYRLYGLFPGRYLLTATFRNDDAADGTAVADAKGFAPTFYPGFADAASAQVLDVALGQDLSALDFPLAPARLATIRGTAVDEDGDPLADGLVLLTRRGASLRAFGTAAASVDTHGAFTLTAVAPGSYELIARTVSPGDVQCAITTVEVSGADLEGLALTARRGGAAEGRLVFDGAALPSFPGSSVQIMPRPLEGDDAPMGFAQPARVRADWSFKLTGLFGAQVLEPVGLPAGWRLKTVRLDGMDVTDAGIDATKATVSGIEVVVTDRFTTVTGSVTDGGSRLADYVVVVFPDDETLWLPNSRFIRTARPDQRGEFKIVGLPPFRYLAAAVPFVDEGQWNDAAFLGRLKTSASAFRLDEAATETLTLRLRPVQ